MWVNLQVIFRFFDSSAFNESKFVVFHVYTIRRFGFFKLIYENMGQFGNCYTAVYF